MFFSRRWQKKIIIIIIKIKIKIIDVLIVTNKRNILLGILYCIYILINGLFVNTNSNRLDWCDGDHVFRLCGPVPTVVRVVFRVSVFFANFQTQPRPVLATDTSGRQTVYLWKNEKNSTKKNNTNINNKLWVRTCFCWID